MLCFSYVYIPLLPASLLEVLHTPTPFIAGVHSSVVPEPSDIVSIEELTEALQIRFDKVRTMKFTEDGEMYLLKWFTYVMYCHH